MENSASKIRINGEHSNSMINHINKDHTEVDILRRAYELILENSDMFYKELAKSFKTEREKGEFNPMI